MSFANMCLTHRTESLSPPQPITIRVLINQDWDQDWEWNGGFKQEILFFNKIFTFILISYVEEFKWKLIVSWEISPYFSLIFSYLNIRSKKERWKFVKTLYFWFSVHIMCICGLILSSFSKSLIKHILQTKAFSLQPFLISITWWHIDTSGKRLCRTCQALILKFSSQYSNLL